MGTANSGAYLIGYVIAAAIAAWVYSDAKKRGMNAVGWAIGVFLVCIVCLPLYLILRKPLLTAGMPGMPPGTFVTQLPPSYIPPPAPGATFAPPPAAPGHFCGQCGQRFEGTVKFCPSCGAPQA